MFYYRQLTKFVAYEKRSYRCIYIFQQLFLEIQDRYRDFIPAYTDGSREGNYVACAIVFSSDTVIIGLSLKPWNKLKIQLHPNILFLDSLSCLQALQYMKLEHPLIAMVMQKYVILNFANKDIFVGYPAIIKLPSQGILILNIILVNILFPLGKMIGMVRSRTSFILSRRPWEIGSPPTDGAGRMK